MQLYRIIRMNREVLSLSLVYTGFCVMLMSIVTFTSINLHCVSVSLASCSFDNHGLILIIFGKRCQRTFSNDAPVQLSLSLYFYLLYLLLNSSH